MALVLLLDEVGPMRMRNRHNWKALQSLLSFAEPIRQLSIQSVLGSPYRNMSPQTPTSGHGSPSSNAHSCLTTELNIVSSMLLGSIFLACAGDLIRRMVVRKLYLYYCTTSVCCVDTTN